ncbi:IclR family transcriptional regulator [Pseudorhodoplanes sp.]|jgi:DNA-binding IclR family transcriptional regulator|uniref:IclR family transcriptional regulator n=1 Tax=Pseudorhodoplanes sp. TaxID=1934341 RepID=UPI002D11E32D|nr:IclR family transcriptional regulator [Pseudorhodoplanes sp.]HWV41848.1 IclR family transcriptional regulator [Pseudorhodoplanes sp.]
MSVAMKHPAQPPTADKHREKAQEKSQVQVIARAASIMRALEDTTTGLSLGEIALKVGLARSTVQRIVAALETEKLVVAASPAGRVRLGPTILRLAGSVRTDFVAVARPFLVELSKELHETVDLASIKGDHLVFIDQVIGSQRLRTVSAVGETFPLYCTANGKAYLATLDDEAIEALIGRNLKARTPHTVTKLSQLLDEIRIVRREGYALDREEHTLGICAAGIAMRDMLGNYVAISVPVPTQRFEKDFKTICERLLATKRTLESQLSSTNP